MGKRYSLLREFEREPPTPEQRAAAKETTGGAMPEPKESHAELMWRVRGKQWQKAAAHAHRLRNLLVSMGVTDPAVLGPEYFSLDLSKAKEMDFVGVEFVPVGVGVGGLVMESSYDSFEKVFFPGGVHSGYLPPADADEPNIVEGEK